MTNLYETDRKMKTKRGLTRERQAMLVAELLGGQSTPKEAMTKAKEFSMEDQRNNGMDDVITFFKRRHCLRRADVSYFFSPQGTCISKDEYATLKKYGTLGREKDDYLRTFMDVWKKAKK